MLLHGRTPRPTQAQLQHSRCAEHPFHSRVACCVSRSANQRAVASLRPKHRPTGIPPLYDRFCLNLTPQEVQHKLMSGVPHTVRMKVRRPHSHSRPPSGPLTTKWPNAVLDQVPSGVTSFTDIVRGAVSFNNAFVNDQVCRVCCFYCCWPRF